MGTRLRSSVALVALVACACSASVPRIGDVPAPSRQPSVTTDVVHKDGLALTFDVYRPTQPNGAGVIVIVSGGWKSIVEMGRLIAQGYSPR